MFSLKKHRQTKSQVELLPGIKETPFPNKGPQIYGRDYLIKFNEFLKGNLSANEIIHIKNVMTTKKPLKKRKMTMLGNKLSVYKVFKSPSPTRLKKNIKIDVEKDESNLVNSEMEQFVMNHVKDASFRPPNLSPLNNNSIQAQRESRKALVFEEDLQASQNTMEKFQKIKEVIDQRMTNKKKLKDQDTLAQYHFKILQNFKFIADEYMEKIKNKDLISSDSTKKYFQKSGLKINTNLNSLSVRKSHDKLQTLSPHDIYSPTKNQLSSNDIQAFKGFADEYLNVLQQNVQTPKIVESLSQNDSPRKNLKVMAHESILDRDFNRRIKKFISMEDLLSKYQQNQEQKKKFIEQISQVDKLEKLPKNPLNNHIHKRQCVRSIENSQSTTPRSTVMSIKAFQSMHSNRPSDRLHYNSGRLDNMQYEEDDESLISETEANLDLLYSQSQLIQNRVMEKDEKLNRLMKHFVKIEEIKTKVLKTNIKKLDNNQQSILFQSL